MTVSLFSRLPACCAAGILIFAGTAGLLRAAPDAAPPAAAPAAAAKAPAIDPKADAILRAACDYIRKTGTFRADVRTVIRLEAEGMLQETETRTLVAREKPGRFALLHQSGINGSTAVCDGKSLTVFLPMANRYLVQPPPQGDDLLAVVMMADGSPISSLADLMTDNPYASHMEGVTAGAYAGLEEIGGVKCHRLHYVQDDFDWDVWVEDSATPVERKVVVDLRKGMFDDDSPLKDKVRRHELTLTLDNWQVDRPLPDGIFTFTPPPGAVKVESQPPPPADDPDQGDPAAMVGKPAPALRGALLDGGTFDLAAQKGKAPVVVTFWATWGAPCKHTLQAVAETAAAFKDKGVVFCTVNQQEKEKDIRAFLAETKFGLPIVLDPDSRIGNAYQVQGIPHTVVIGRDGRVYAVHAGFTDALKNELAADVEEVLEGKEPGLPNLPLQPLQLPAAPAAAPVPPPGAGVL